MSSDLIARALAQRALKAVGETQGADAYEVAVANGFVGSRSAWLASLKGAAGQDGDPGEDGAPGKDAYQIALDAGFAGDRAAWLASLAGPPGGDGDPGEDGAPGKDAYQIAVDAGFVGDRAAWLASLKGADADPAALQQLQQQLDQALQRIAVLESPDALGPLGLSEDTVLEDAAPGDLIGVLTGRHPFETIVQTGDAGGRLIYADGDVVVGLVGFDYETATSHELVLQRTLAKPGRPIVEEVATITVHVGDVAETPIVDVVLPSTGETPLILDYTGVPAGNTVTISVPADFPIGLRFAQ